MAERYFEVETPSLGATLDRRRGLALASLHFAGQQQPALGGLPHGYFDDIALAGRLVHRRLRLRGARRAQAHRPGMVRGASRARTEWRHPGLRAHRNAERADSKRTCASAPTRRGSNSISPSTGTIGARASCGWAISRCCPMRSSWPACPCHHQWRRTANAFALAGQTIDHGAPVSFLVSSSHGLGMTEGWAEIGDGKTRLRIEVDRATRAAAGPAHPPARRAEKLVLPDSALGAGTGRHAQARKPIGPVRAASASRFASARDLTQIADGRRPPASPVCSVPPTKNSPRPGARCRLLAVIRFVERPGSRRTRVARPPLPEAYRHPGTETGWSAAPDWRSTEPGCRAAA